MSSSKIIFPSDLLSKSPSIVRFKLFKNSDSETPVHTILLPVPLALSSAYNVSFDDLEAGLIEKIVTSVAQGINQTTGLGSGFEQFAKVAIDTAATVLGESKILRRKLGSSVNKKNELVINKPANRTFSLRFQLVPSNEQESTIIQRIIKVFKIAMHPPTNSKVDNQSKDSSTTAGGIYFINPAKVKIDFLFNRPEEDLTEDSINRKIFSTNFCFIQSLDVNYHEAGAPAYFDDGQPGNMSFNITLQEIGPNSREMINDLEYGTSAKGESEGFKLAQSSVTDVIVDAVVDGMLGEGNQ